MTTCSGKFGVRVNGTMQWFTDEAEARRVEREQIRKISLEQRKPSYKILVKGL